MNAVLSDKREKLHTILADIGGCVIGFSGGVDSALLFAVATAVLGSRVLAVTAMSQTFPARELQEARELAEQIGGRHLVIISDELDIPEFRDNPRNRCYYCKKELFGKLRAIADQESLGYVLDGTNVDDADDHRPGRIAAEEFRVRSPLEEAGFTKQDIRDLSREMGLPTWDKPALACLSSRFPYGTSITPERISQVGLAEELLRELGFQTLRVRYHGSVARIELGEQEFGQATGILRTEIVARVKTAGFTYVALDLQGYRTGAMNE
ncbi:MAG: ATP-dependent sacrificial sulfur transferase LarE [Desulfuromonadaceae bacterium]|nr:ATP-dependent sacrificial sulfur transferase LarE [Desulfuromonadaceae bacterium]